jgi:DNA replication ATP-dependent helicase Dna2
MFDRLLEGARDLEALYRELLPQHAVQLASIVDEFFDEAAFRSEVLRHAAALQAFIDSNPQVLEDPQIELKRYSSTLGIQGRIDAMFRRDRHLDILELKTGARIRAEDHAQLFIYRLLLSDLVRRWQRGSGANVDISARLLSSTDGAYAPLQIQTDFQQVMDARNRLVAVHYALGLQSPHFRLRYEGFNEKVCGSCPSWVRERCRETTAVFGDKPGVEETPELGYFRKFSRLLETERWRAEQDLVELLDDNALEARRKNFRCITDARLVEDEDAFTFEFEDNTSDLAPGDAVLIHSGNISSTSIFHGRVRATEVHRIRLSIPLKNLSPAVFAAQRWIVDRYPSDVTSEASHTALYDYLTGGSHAPVSSLRWSGQDPDPFPGDSPRKAMPLESRARPSHGPAPAIPAGFNDSQRKAIQRSVTCSRYHLIWGPPGTGKTKVIPEIVRRIEGRVLMGAFTNTAVDTMLMALLSADPEVRFIRIGRSADSPELAAMLPDPSDYFSEDLARKSTSIHDLRKALDSAPIVAATAHRACTMPYLRRRAFEMAVVDEAGQLTEPLTLGLILRASRFVLIGDDRQLPPVVRTRELAHSMFERLKRQAERERASTLTLLDTQYRMHPQIMAVSNKLFYEGRLRTGVAPEDRLPPDGGPLLMVPVDAASEGRKNEAEAQAVAALVERYLEEFGVPAEAIGVVSPFRAQVVLLRKRLQDTGVAVDTVERFQGGERDIMILSLVRSEGGGFVFDDRRLNVAITRARRKLVLVAHPQLFRNSKFEWLSAYAAP